MLNPCNHKFHHSCIKQWMDRSPRCPLDRRLITGTKPRSSFSVNLQKELFKAIKANNLQGLKEVLSAGFTPEQLSWCTWKKPLTLAIEKRHWEIAAELLRAGWTTNDTRAHYHLGRMYQKGLGVKQDFAKALFWYRKSANKEDSLAQNQLGWLYEHGLGVKQDYAEAFFWYSKAAVNVNPQARANLARLYQNRAI